MNSVEPFYDPKLYGTPEDPFAQEEAEVDQYCRQLEGRRPDSRPSNGSSPREILLAWDICSEICPLGARLLAHFSIQKHLEVLEHSNGGALGRVIEY